MKGIFNHKINPRLMGCFPFVLLRLLPPILAYESLNEDNLKKEDDLKNWYNLSNKEGSKHNKNIAQSNTYDRCM